MDKKNKMIYERSCFNVKDSSVNFIFALIIPFLASIVLFIAFMLIAALCGMSYKEFASTEFVKVVNLIFTPITFFLIYYIYCRKKKIQVFKASDIDFKVDWKMLLVVAVMSVVAIFFISPFVTLFNYGLSQIGYHPSNDLPYVMNNWWRFIIGLLSMAVLPAFCEELLFRGLIYKGLEDKLGPHKAIVISATMFMLLHGSLQQTVYQFILGILLGYAMYYGKSIIYPMVLHCVNNLTVVITSFVYTLKGLDTNVDPVYQNAWEYIYPILLLLFAGVLLVGLIHLLKRFNSKNLAKQTAVATDENATIVKDNSNIDNKNEIKNEKEESIDSSANIIDSSKKLSKEELLYLWSSIGLSILLWLSNTIMQFFGLM